MTRSRIKPLLQPNEYSCGPSTLKTALSILGVRKSLSSLTKLCHTSVNGTSTSQLIKAALKSGVSVLEIQNATLAHIQSVLQVKPPQSPLAMITAYLYADSVPIEETGHFAVIAGYSSRTGRIILFDSFTGVKKSYLWTKFTHHWYGYDHKRVRAQNPIKGRRLYRRWHSHLLLILSREASNLPRYTISSQKSYLSNAL